MTFSIQAMARAAKTASVQLANTDTLTKNKVLFEIAENLRANVPPIVEANKLDLAAAKDNGLSDAMIDRLMLDSDRIENIAQAVEHIAITPNGLKIAKQRIPLGVIAMVYESRPNVTVDAAVLCFKAGNSVVLRGGKEALNSNKALAQCIHQALENNGLAKDVVSLVPDPDREIMNEMLTLSESIDLVIPRGGEGLIRFVTKNSQIPVIQHFKGVCHLYVDKHADLNKALPILLNGKVQRPGVCNSLETLVVHQDVAEAFLPMAATEFAKSDVKVHACQQSIGYFANADEATDLDYDAEYLALEIAVKVVKNFEQAVEHIQRFSSGHTEVIVSQDISATQEFVRRINSAVVMVNASSRFSDGGELGLGAEIGISTSKLHAYGPMGLESLTTEKFVVTGNGQIRG